MSESRDAIDQSNPQFFQHSDSADVEHNYFILTVMKTIVIGIHGSLTPKEVNTQHWQTCSMISAHQTHEFRPVLPHR
jgi:hypothetical protein